MFLRILHAQQRRPLALSCGKPMNNTPDMDNKFVRYFSCVPPLSEAEATAIAGNRCVKTFKKGAYLLQQGQLSVDTFFLMEGCVRGFMVAGGEGKTTDFFTEEQWVISLRTVKLSKNPSGGSISRACKPAVSRTSELSHFAKHKIPWVKGRKISHQSPKGLSPGSPQKRSMRRTTL